MLPIGVMTLSLSLLPVLTRASTVAIARFLGLRHRALRYGQIQRRLTEWDALDASESSPGTCVAALALRPGAMKGLDGSDCAVYAARVPSAYSDVMKSADKADLA